MIATGSHEVSTDPPTREQLHALIEGWDAEHGEVISNALRRRGVPWHDLDAARLDVFRKSSASLSRGYPPRESTRRWLIAIAGSVAIDYHRQRQRENDGRSTLDESAVASTGADPLTELCRGEISDAMNAAIEKLPPIQQQLIIYSYLENKTNAKIAKDLGVSPVTVAKRIKRALNELRNQMSGFEADI